MFAERFDRWIILLLGAVCFLPFLGGVHLFDWDEINFAECAREMVETGNYLRVQINYLPFWEKPPLFLWMQAGAMHVFGIGEYAARLPNAICGILTLQVLYNLGRKVHDRKFAWWWVGTYLGSILPHFYFKSGIIDPWFNLFIFLGIYLLWRVGYARWEMRDLRFDLSGSGRFRMLLLAGVFTGLAILTKGPVALLLTFLTLVGYWIYRRFAWFLNLKHGLIYLTTVVLVPGLWFGVEWVQNGPWFTQTFLEYQVRLLTTEDAGHGGFPGYHFVVLLLGCFPVSWWMLGNLKTIWRARTSAPIYDFAVWMMILLVVVLLLFSLVQSKIVHYSSLAYFPITFLGALGIREFSDRLAGSSWLRYATLFTGVLLGIVPLLLPYLGRHPELIAPLFAKDEFAQGNLAAAVSWSGWESLLGVLFLLSVGYAFKTWTNNFRRAAFTLLIGTIILVQGIFYLFIGKIEGYSQRAVIEFYESMQNEPIYVQPIGFKSYAHLFYTRRLPAYPERGKDKAYLQSNEIDRTTWLVVRKRKDADRLRNLPNTELVEYRNGFYFLRRNPNQ